MGELFAPLQDDLESPIDEPRMERIFDSLRRDDFRSQRPPRRLRVGLVAAAMLGLLMLSGVALMLWSARTPNDESGDPIRLLSGEPLATLVVPEGRGSASNAGFQLDDGSSIVLSSGARIEALENTGREIILDLQSGRARFEVRPDGPRRWVVDAGLLSVVVTGTVFSVERSDEAVEVIVTRGEVRLEGEAVPGRLAHLSRGESMTIRREAVTLSESSEVVSKRITSDDEERPTKAVTEEVIPTTKGEARPRTWRTFAEQRAFPEAYELLGAEGIAVETERATTVDDLFSLADVARLSGHPRDAVLPLERIIEGYASHGRASVAAFTLGRLQLEVLGNPHQARRAFERTIQLGAPPGLAEDAMARLVEARARAGDRSGAQAVAAEYMRRYPEGRLISQVRSWAELDER